MQEINPKKVGMVLGGFLGLWHLVWSALVALGLAQWLADTIFKLHMVKPILMVQPFNLGIAAMLIIVTSLIGCVAGWVLATLWNWVHKK